MSVADIARTVLTHSSGLAAADASGGRVATIALAQVTTGLTGPSGSQGIAQISTDPGNALQPGTDNRLFVPRDPFLSTADW